MLFALGWWERPGIAEIAEIKKILSSMGETKEIKQMQVETKFSDWKSSVFPLQLAAAMIIFSLDYGGRQNRILTAIKAFW